MVPRKNVALEPRHLGSVKCHRRISTVTGPVLGSWQCWLMGPASGVKVLIPPPCDLRQVNNLSVSWRIGTITSPAYLPSREISSPRDFSGFHRGDDA